ncbi:hypothetical protein QQ008_29185 [Fulvivirgaceae bacterium BMA10]|uniref:Uncharacterized protein n=1 Tax=Splendidivirga corallicola TaxID=3051826 RepID=A0ABT8KZE4_9BACT|nr:hypothetical protein [Fulvivirgaceae bacterium BMA10]
MKSYKAFLYVIKKSIFKRRNQTILDSLTSAELSFINQLEKDDSLSLIIDFLVINYDRKYVRKLLLYARFEDMPSHPMFYKYCKIRWNRFLKKKKIKMKNVFGFPKSIDIQNLINSKQKLISYNLLHNVFRNSIVLKFEHDIKLID